MTLTKISCKWGLEGIIWKCHWQWRCSFKMVYNFQNVLLHWREQCQWQYVRRNVCCQPSCVGGMVSCQQRKSDCQKWCHQQWWPRIAGILKKKTVSLEEVCVSRELCPSEHGLMWLLTCSSDLLLGTYLSFLNMFAPGIIFQLYLEFWIHS